jgi:hypothetical protein
MPRTVKVVTFATCLCCRLTPEDYVKNKSEVGPCNTDPGLQQVMSGTLKLYLMWREFPNLPAMKVSDLRLFEALNDQASLMKKLEAKRA